MVHNISERKNKASQGRRLGGFWSQIASNKCAILILALKLPFLERSQYHNLCSIAHFKLETLLIFWFAFLQKKIIIALDEICNPSYSNLRIQRRILYRQNPPWEKTFFSFLPSSFFWLSFGGVSWLPLFRQAWTTPPPSPVSLHWDALV